MMEKFRVYLVDMVEFVAAGTSIPAHDTREARRTVGKPRVFGQIGGLSSARPLFVWRGAANGVELAQ